MSCKRTDGMWKTKIRGYHLLNYNSLDYDIMRAIYNNGPVSVIINAGDREFLLYR